MSDPSHNHPPPEHLESLLSFANEHLSPLTLISLLHLLTLCPQCEQYAGDLGQRATLEALDDDGHHFDSESLGELVWSLLEHPDAEIAAYLRHLASACHGCAPLMARLFRGPRSSSLDSRDQERIRQRFDRLRMNWSTDNALEREQAPEHCDELLRCPDQQRPLLIRNCERFQTWALSGLLCERSRALAPLDATAAIDMAALAVLVADHLDLAAYGPTIVEDVRATARAFLGNALRVNGRLVLADREFERAVEHLQRGTGTDLGRLQVLELLAHQRNAQRRREEALVHLTEVEAIRRASGDDHWLGRTLLTRADIERELGHYHRCLEILDQAEPLLDLEAEPRLGFLLQHQRLQAALELEDFDAAGSYLEAAREACAEAGDLDRLRLDWLASRVLRGLGRPAAAATALRHVRDGFLARGLATDAALAVLELATLYLERGLLRQVQHLAESIVQTFSVENLGEEALGALLIFCRAAQVEQATVATLDATVRQATQQLYRIQPGRTKDTAPLDDDSVR